jgi:amino acid adenylation domain-containing protein
VDPTAADRVDGLLEGVEEPRLVLLPDAADVSALAARHPRHRILGARDLAPADACTLGPADPDGVAYVMFTSGSTGRPKGVVVAHRNVTAFVDVMVERYGITEADRFSQTFDLTFDLSVFDMFCAWERGACLCVPTAQEKAFPAKYVARHALTVFFGVPSTGVLMSRLRMLKPGRHPSLRWVLFCGEALPAEIAERFAAAAPNAAVENLYGPTELTIACTLHRWDPATSPSWSERGVVPIGEPFPGMEALVCDEALREVPRGAPGELLMTGPQLTLGYWDDPDKTDEVFVTPPGRHRVHYRTGDRVRWPRGEPMRYLGRVDHQIKVQGYRVELGEVEAVLREVSGAEVAVAIGWPRTASGADGLVGFVGDPDGDAEAILAAARARLPAYMQPSAVHLVDRFPLNANGKVDRGALRAALEG